jgi:hypothetical protein
MLKSIHFFLFFVAAGTFFAQQNSLEVNPLGGSLFNHSPSFKAIITEPSFGLRVNYLNRPRKAGTFFEKFNYPSIGVATHIVRYGDNEIFGSSFGFNSTISFYLKEREKYNIQTTLGLGAGYLTTKFDQATNPINTAIGSNFNFSASLQFSSELFLTQKLAVKPALGVLHYSNAHLLLPNLGTNYLFGSVGLVTYFNRKYQKDSFINNQTDPVQFKNEIIVSPGLSDRGRYIENRVLPTYAFLYNRLFWTSRHHTLKAGISGEYKNYDYDYKTFTFEENADLALTFGNEIYFGRASFHALLGVYLYSYLSAEKKKHAYQRWGMSYHFPMKSKKIGLSAGATLKVHYGAAELLEGRFAILF